MFGEIILALKALASIFAAAYPYVAVALVVYSVARQQQLSRRMRAAQDAAKGTTIPVEAEVRAVLVPYGRVLIGGNRVYHNTSNNYIHAANSGPYFKEFLSGIPRIVEPARTELVPVMQNTTVGENTDIIAVQVLDANGNPVYETRTTPATVTQTGTTLEENKSGSRNEYLFIQQVIGFGEIEDVVDVIITPDRFYNNTDFRHGQRINIFKKGNIVDQMIAANFPERADAAFPEMTYASMCFRLNRDAPQFQGVPEIQFLVKGRKLKDIIYSSGVYSLSATESYSNNPARVLLDYLMSPLYGLNLTLDKIDLESFYKAKLVCDTVVATNKPAFGHIWVPSSSDLYLQPVEESAGWHPFLKQNAVWQYNVQTTGNNDLELATSIDKTFSIYLAAGTYTFYMTADDDFTLTVNGTVRGQQTNASESLFTYTVTIPTTGLQTIRVQASQGANNSGSPVGVALTIDDTSPEKNNVFNLKNPQLATMRATLPLYECNLVIDPETNIRDNLETILETMNSAELVWSNGKYKLICSYPSNESEIFAGLTTEEINQRLITDDMIINDSFSMKWPNASEKLNYCTIKFANEALDFKDDSVSWPDKNPNDPLNTVYNTMLIEDNNVRLEADFYEKGITDVDHALAKAEERVRKSRSAVSYEFKLFFNGFIYEPGDILRLRSDLFNIGVLANEYIQIQETTIDQDFNIQIRANRFDINSLAWNVADNVYSPYNPVTRNTVFQRPYNITLTNKTVSWNDAANTRAISYKAYFWYGGSSVVPGGTATGEPVRYFTNNLTNNPVYHIKLTEITKIFYGPDISTLAQSLAKAGNNTTLTAVLNAYLADSAVNADFVNNTNTEYISSLYRRILNREPDIEGLLLWSLILTTLGNSGRVPLFLSFVDRAYEQGLFFQEFAATNIKEAQIPSIEGLAAFTIKGFDTNNNSTDFSIVTRLFEIDGTDLVKSVIIQPAAGSSDTFLTAAGATVPAPTTQTYEAVTTNFLDPSYAWYIDDVLQATQTASSITINSFEPTATKVLKVVVTDFNGTDVFDTFSVNSIRDGGLYNVIIESTNGDVFRVGQTTTTTLIAHVFLNDEEVTATIPASRFRWRRISQTPRPYPNDDESWNNLFASGYKQIEITIDSVYAFATFHCDILSEQ